MFEKILKFFSADKDPNNAEKHQKLNLIIIGTGLFAILMFLMLLFGGDNNTKKSNIGQFKIVNENEAVKTKWMGQVAPQVEITQSEVRKAIRENQQLKRQIENLQQMIIQMKEKQNSNTQNPNNINQNPNNINIPSTNPNPNNNQSNGLYKSFPLPPHPENPQEVGLVQYGKIPVLKKRIIVKEEPLGDTLVYKKVSSPKKETKKESTPKPYNMINTGTIIPSILLGGMDAPTMARAKNNPLPVLLKVTSLAFLPNDWREDVKGCFLLGEGYGDLSSERAYIKITTLSCVTKDGYHIDTPFRGAVYGEDGKVGMRGRVVTKQGALLARSIIAGFLQGVAEAFKQSTTVVSVNPNGTTQTINPSKALQAGAYNGASEAANKLADFYLKMADQVAPVIEISAGRKVDVIALQPIKLTPIEFLKKGKK